MKRFQTIYTLVFTLLLLNFSAYALLDTFSISRVYQVVSQEPMVSPAVETAAVTEADTAESDEAEALPQPLQSHRPARGPGSGKHPAQGGGTQADGASQTEAPTPAEMAADTSFYSDDDLSVEIRTCRLADTTVYVADIRVSSPALLKTAFARSSYGRNVTASTSATAESVGAVLAVNGDNYGSRERGYVIRNGVLYRDTAAKGQEDLVIWADGSFEIIREDEVTAQELLDRGAVQVFSFGPGLLEDGEITVGTQDEVDRAMASNPRTAIGILGEGHYVLVVSDGRSGESEGLSLYELAVFMQSLGVQTAYNLDGGGSSTLVFRGEVLNNPSGRGSGERAVTDIVYLA